MLQAIKFERGGKVTRGEASPEVIEKLVEHRARELAGEMEVSVIRQRLAKIRASSKRAIIETFSDNGEDWFIRSISVPLFQELKFRTPRDQNGLLVLDEEPKYEAFMAACFYCCLVSGADDLTPLFPRTEQGWEDAIFMAREGGDQADVNGMLISSILLLNPDILPEATIRIRQTIAAAQRSAEEESEADFLGDAAEDSTNTSDSAPESGSNEILSTSLPSTAPTGSSSPTEAHLLTLPESAESSK